MTMQLIKSQMSEGALLFKEVSFLPKKKNIEDRKIPFKMILG